MKTSNLLNVISAKLFVFAFLAVLAVNSSSQTCDPAPIKIPHEVVVNRISGKIGPRLVYVQIAPANFNESSLLRLFQCLSTQYSDKVLKIFVSSNRDDIKSKAERESVPTPYLPDDVLKSKIAEQAKLGAFDSKDDILRAYYFRDDVSEYFSFDRNKRKSVGSWAVVTVRDQEKFTETDDFFFRSIVIGHKAAVDWLIERKKNLNVRDSNGNTPLILASALSIDQIAESLIVSGAEVNVSNKFGDAPLMYAVDNEDDNLVRMLLG